MADAADLTPVDVSHERMGMPRRAITSVVTAKPPREARVGHEPRGDRMADKSPRKPPTKKSGKTLKEKRQDKKDKKSVFGQ